jgi:hypothetical protein
MFDIVELREKHTVVIVRALSNGCSKDTGYKSEDR